MFDRDEPSNLQAAGEANLALDLGMEKESIVQAVVPGWQMLSSLVGDHWQRQDALDVAVLGRQAQPPQDLVASLQE